MRTLLLFLLCSLQLNGAIVSLGGSTIFLSDFSTPVPVDSYISVGYFDFNFSDFAGLESQSWDDLTTSIYTEINSGYINPVSGEWAGGGNSPGIEGQKLFVWVFDSPAPPVFLSDTEFGLFTGSSPEWYGEGDGEILQPRFNFLSIESVDTAHYGTDLGADLALAPIPEPSQFVLVAGLFACLLACYKSRREAGGNSNGQR